MIVLDDEDTTSDYSNFQMLSDYDIYLNRRNSIQKATLEKKKVKRNPDNDTSPETVVSLRKNFKRPIFKVPTKDIKSKH